MGQQFKQGDKVLFGTLKATVSRGDINGRIRIKIEGGHDGYGAYVSPEGLKLVEPPLPVLNAGNKVEYNSPNGGEPRKAVVVGRPRGAAGDENMVPVVIYGEDRARLIERKHLKLAQ